MAFEGDGEQFAQEYQDDDYLPGDGEAAEGWPEEPEYGEGDPGGEYELTYEQGLETGYDTTAAEIGHTIVQGQETVRQQREQQQQLEEWRQQVDAAEGYLGRALSPGEVAALVADGQDPGGHHDVANALNDYWTPAEDTPAGRSEHREKVMRNSIEAVRAANEPGYEIELPGSADNWGLEPGASIYQRAEAKQRWAEQQMRLRSGELTYDPSEQDD